MTRYFAISFVYAIACGVQAQLPTSVDIDLFGTEDPDSLEVRVRANGNSYEGLVSALTFTVRWPASSTAGLGGSRSICPDGLPMAGGGTFEDGGFRYRSFNGFGLQAMGAACVGHTWPEGEWVPVLRIGVNNITGCTAFNIANDAWTGANNRDYFISLQGLEATGSIEPEADEIGACTPDCLGVIGGPDLPGAPCDDNDVCTLNDAWDPACVCVGTLQDADSDGTCDAEDACPDDPLKIAPGTCGCGTPDTDSDADGLADCVDDCPATPGVIGSVCDDGVLGTIDDVIGSDCLCAGTLVDCDDDDTCTSDAYDGTACVNTPLPDTDADGVCDLLDLCPDDPLKIAPGTCGCGTPDTDGDADGLADCIDDCPNTVGSIGSACDDGEPLTLNDTLNGQCVCTGTPANDACSDAVAIVLNDPWDCPSAAVTGTTAGASGTPDQPSCLPGGSPADVWYTFNTGEHTVVTVDLALSGATQVGFSLLDGCSGAELICVADATGPLDVEVPANADLLLAVHTDTHAGSPGTFNLCIAYSIGGGLSQQRAARLDIFPNPGNGELTMHLPGVDDVAVVRVLDIDGREVHRSVMGIAGRATATLDLRHLASGTYALELQGKEQHRTLFVIER